MSKLGLFYQYKFKCGIDFKENVDIKFDTLSIPDYWANIYFKTNFNH
jgi:hypothetical protein